MTDSIKPIETKYNGYRFRSRLEARWAIFFDSIEIAYEYEPEGFDLKPVYDALTEKGKSKIDLTQFWYLPDFYLPDYGYYVEIRPLVDPEDNKDAFDKCWLLSREKNVLCVLGVPGRDDYGVLEHQRSDLAFAGLSYFALGRKCDRLWLVHEEQSRGLNCSKCWSPQCGQKPTKAHYALHDAYEAARSARF